jgi:hypothetical protein
MDGRRDIGPLGTLVRVIAGTTFVAVPIAEHGISWWDAGGALIILPSIALGVAGLLRAHQAAGAAVTRGQAIVAIALVIGAGTALTFITPIDGLAVWAFFGVSMLLTALRGYAGCELLAIPNALTGRRDQIGCFIYTPIDAAEATRLRCGGPKASS